MPKKNKKKYVYHARYGQFPHKTRPILVQVLFLFEFIPQRSLSHTPLLSNITLATCHETATTVEVNAGNPFDRFFQNDRNG